MTDRTSPDAATRAAEKQEAVTPAGADAPPTSEEEARADRHHLAPGVAEHEKEMGERGAHQQGEGQLP